MTNNLAIGPTAAVNHSLALLRAAAFEIAVEPRLPLVPGIVLATDPAAVVLGTVTSRPGEMLSLHLMPQGPVRWVSLTLDLGWIDFGALDLLGIVCRTRAPRAVTMVVHLRTALEGGNVDVAFRKSVVAYAEPSLHMDAFDFSRDLGVPRGMAKREVVVMFEHTDFAVDLLNFSVFVA
ncbi:MAG: hypothetical protein ABI832_14505 [bacterium]